MAGFTAYTPMADPAAALDLAPVEETPASSPTENRAADCRFG